MKRPINAGKGWTVLSAECLLTNRCGTCPYIEYCVRNMRDGKPILKAVVSILLEKVGSPPNNILHKAKEEVKNPIVLYNLKKNEN